MEEKKEVEKKEQEFKNTQKEVNDSNQRPQPDIQKVMKGEVLDI